MFYLEMKQFSKLKGLHRWRKGLEVAHRIFFIEPFIYTKFSSFGPL